VLQRAAGGLCQGHTPQVEAGAHRVAALLLNRRFKSWQPRDPASSLVSGVGASCHRFLQGRDFLLRQLLNDVAQQHDTFMHGAALDPAPPSLPPSLLPLSLHC
jgi:hypothetical protein